MHLTDLTQVANSVVRSFPSQHWTLPPTPPPDSLSLHAAAQPYQRKMELGNILNTKNQAKAVAGNPHYYDMQSMQPDMQAPQQPQPQYPPPPYLNGRIKSETGSDRTVSPHTSDPRYPPPPQQAMPGYGPPMSNNYGTDMRYPSPSANTMGVPMPMPNGYHPNGQADNPYAQQQGPEQTVGRIGNENGPPKAFACSTCGKGFARRSDLARHGEFTDDHFDIRISLIRFQNVFTAVFVRMSATSPTAVNSSSSAQR
jgi:hypothetical protein